MPIQAFLASPIMVMIRYLGLQEVADRTGLSYNTIKAYSQTAGKMPQADCLVGRVKGWLPETIDRWMERRGQRPGMHGED